MPYAQTLNLPCAIMAPNVGHLKKSFEQSVNFLIWLHKKVYRKSLENPNWLYYNLTEKVWEEIMSVVKSKPWLNQVHTERVANISYINLNKTLAQCLWVKVSYNLLAKKIEEEPTHVKVKFYT